MKIVHHLDGDPGEIIVVSAVADDEAAGAVKQLIGNNRPYYAFANTGLPAGFEASDNKVVDWNGAPLSSNTEATNQTNIDAMLANPPTSKLSSS